MQDIDQLRIKLFCDGADFGSLMTWAMHPRIQGFTTNPTLMRKSRVVDYEAFARELIRIIPDRPISFEVLADDPEGMEEQALAIASWGANVNVKIPVINTWGAFTGPVLRRLSRAGVRLNVTALFTLEQVERVATELSRETEVIETESPVAPAASKASKAANSRSFDSRLDSIESRLAKHDMFIRRATSAIRGVIKISRVG